jgi:hypothetical protein
MKEITLSRAQIERLYKITNHFKEIQNFTIMEDGSSGIGPAISVKCDLSDIEMKADITEYDKW